MSKVQLFVQTHIGHLLEGQDQPARNSKRLLMETLTLNGVTLDSNKEASTFHLQALCKLLPMSGSQETIVIFGTR